LLGKTANCAWKRHQVISDERYQTEELERKLAFHAARLNELVREAVQKQLSGGATQDDQC